MIQLTRLNKELLVVNSDLIKFVEHAPDTVLTLITGEKLVVRESLDEVLQRIVAFRRSILTGLGTQTPAHLGQNPPSNTVLGGREETR
jgi:flagellar protein FlbD